MNTTMPTSKGLSKDNVYLGRVFEASKRFCQLDNFTLDADLVFKRARHMLCT